MAGCPAAVALLHPLRLFARCDVLNQDCLRKSVGRLLPSSAAWQQSTSSRFVQLCSREARAERSGQPPGLHDSLASPVAHSSYCFRCFADNAAQKAEAERRAAEEARLVAERAEAERIAREKAEAERIAAEQARAAAEKAQAERMAREKAEAERRAGDTQLFIPGD